MMFDVGTAVMNTVSHEVLTVSTTVRRHARGLVISWDDTRRRVLVLWMSGPDKGRMISQREDRLVEDPGSLRVANERARLTREYTARNQRKDVKK